jgi:hypothetical protein
MSSEFRKQHYVPRWYQERFFPADISERKFYYLDMRPDIIETGKDLGITRSPLLRWGTKRCFRQEDLYTTTFADGVNVDIEKFFFGPIDSAGQRAVEHFAAFEHPNWSEEAFNNLLPYMSVQKLRTPKGLGGINMINRATDRNAVLFFIQQVRDLYCATWSESIWQIADASQSPTKFIVSDHPVAVYNRGCFPLSKWCRGFNEPDIRQVATHTLFPLSLDKILILTNLAWARNPYQSEIRFRPNAELFRETLFNFQTIQTGRILTEDEVLAINFIIKRRAHRYVAAAKRDWLFPEDNLATTHWNKLGDGLLLMPDPRALYMGGETTIRFESGRTAAYSEYGHRPGQPGFRDEKREKIESAALRRFQAEFAYRYGPRRRGRSFAFSRLDDEEDDAEFHNYYVEQHRAFTKLTSSRKRR